MKFIDFSVVDAIDILAVGLLIWQIYRAIRGTAAMTIFTGIFSLYLLSIIVEALEMELLSKILNQVLGVGVLALIIVFQQEVRRYLLMLGNKYTITRKGFFRRLLYGDKAETREAYINEIVNACFEMSNNNTGALIAIERTGDLDPFVVSGDILNAQISSRLIQNIFFDKAPLHDGAMVIKNGRIWAARCMLPVSDNPHIPAKLGMRHRAAIGLSEQSDACIIVVSEETGGISFVQNGTLNPVKTREELVKLLQEE